MAKLSIEIFSDIVCPWCFIGTRRLDTQLASLAAHRDDVELTLSYRPFLLDPDCPPAGKNVPEMLRQKYGGEPRQMFAVVEAAAKESGIALDLERQPSAYPTGAAHALLRHAHEKGTQGALAQGLFEAYFLKAQNISDEDVLVQLAARNGFNDDEARSIVRDPAELDRVLAEAQAASRAGISGVPFFLFNERLAISGAQPDEVFRQTLEQALA